MPAPAYNIHQSAGSAAGVTSLTTASFTIGGTNRALVGAVSSAAGSPVDPTSCKWGGSGGTSLTKDGATEAFATFFRHSLFTLTNPTAQTSTGFCNWSGSQDETFLGFIAVTGADQSATFGTSARATTAGGSTNDLTPTVSVTTVVDQLVVDAVFFGDSGAGSRTLTAAGGQTKRVDLGGGAVHPGDGMAMSHKDATTTSTAMDWTISGLGTIDGHSIIAIPINQVAGGGDVLMAQAIF